MVVGYSRKVKREVTDYKKELLFLTEDYLKDIKHPTKAEKRDKLTDRIFMGGALLLAGSLFATFLWLLFNLTF